MPGIDLHVHSVFSDGTFTPRQMVELAVERGLTTVALTDHDSVNGLDDAFSAGDELGVEIVPGIRPYVLAISSASLLYIAMSDLIPDLHRGELDTNGLRQVLLIAAGIGTIVLFERMVG